MRTAVVTLVALCCFALAADPAPESIPGGAGQFVVESGGRKLDVFTYKPKNYAGGPLLVVFHGTNRNADDYRDFARGMADRFQALAVAPRFDNRQFPNEAYHNGGILRRGQPQAAEQYTVNLALKVVEEVRRREDRPDLPYYFIGHSAGGQFLSRTTGFFQTGAVRIVAANPGAHLFPTRDMPFPYGFGNLPEELSTDDVLKRYLAQPLTIYVGVNDVGTAQLPMGPVAMRQGATRYERGKNCFQAGQELARAKGWPCNWTLVEAPGIAHSGRGMFHHKNVAEALFGPARKLPGR